MPVRKTTAQQSIEQKRFDSSEEIDLAVKKLERRVAELEALDVKDAVLLHTGADEVAASNVRATIRDVFGPSSPEYAEHQNLSLWAGPMRMGMSAVELIEGKRRGQAQVIRILQGLIQRLQEQRTDLAESASLGPQTYFDRLNLHPRIADVASDLFMDGYHWEAVFAASKALVNYVKERSGRHDLDGAPLMRTAFSKNNPLLAFNGLGNQTDQDEQEGMMHMFEGAVLAIRNPGGHTFPEGSEQRALEYISLLSLLAYRVQETKRLPKP